MEIKEELLQFKDILEKVPISNISFIYIDEDGKIFKKISDIYERGPTKNSTETECVNLFYNYIKPNYKNIMLEERFNIEENGSTKIDYEKIKNEFNDYYVISIYTIRSLTNTEEVNFHNFNNSNTPVPIAVVLKKDSVNI